MLAACRSVPGGRRIFLKPDGQSAADGFFRHGLQKKIILTQPEGVERKILIAAPYDQAVGIKSTQMLGGDKPGYTPGRAITAFVGTVSCTAVKKCS